MSDRVRFATRNITDSLESSGFNGFPWRAHPTATGGTAPFSVGPITLSQWIRWYWRVKIWNLVTDFEAGGYSFPNGDLETTKTRELDLIEDGGTLMGIGDPAPPEDGGASATFSLGSSTSFGGHVLDEEGYWPDINISGSLNNGIGDGFSFGSNPGGPEAPFVVGEIDGEEMKIYYSDVDELHTHTTFILTPVEFWPYAAADTSPIYDTATGNQIQLPIN